MAPVPVRTGFRDLVPPFHLVVCEEKHAFPSYASADTAFIDSLLLPMRFMAPKFHFAATGSSAMAIRMGTIVVMEIGVGAIHGRCTLRRIRDL